MYALPPPYGAPGYGAPGYGAPPPPAYYPPPQQQQAGPTIINLSNNNNSGGSPCRTCGKDTDNLPRKKVGCVAIAWCLCLLLTVGAYIPSSMMDARTPNSSALGAKLSSPPSLPTAADKALVIPLSF